MSHNILGLMYRETFVLDESTLAAIAAIFNDHGWTYNVDGPSGFWRDDVDDWVFEESTDDQQDDQKLQNAIRNVVEADGGALLFSRDPPNGKVIGTRMRISPPSEEADYWEVSIMDRALPFSGEENRSNQRLLVDLFTDLVDYVSPYVGNLGMTPAVYHGFDGDFTAPPRYFTGVTYLSYDVPGIPLEDLKAAGVAYRVVKLSDGIMFEACENDPPWSYPERDLEELESFLGMDYYPN